MLLLASINPFIFFGKSDLAGQIIFVILCFMSLLAWTTMFGKYFQLKRIRDNNARFTTSLTNAPSVVEVQTQGYTNCPYAELTSAAIAALDRAQRMAVNTSAQMQHVENAIQRTLNTVSLKYESKLILLGSMVSGAPFLGLLGTVWGIMLAFAEMGLQNGVATIQALAPGVAAALLCTVTGLVVAIPAVFGYNYLLTQAKSMVSELENFSSALADRIELESFSMQAANEIPHGNNNEQNTHETVAAQK
jgi:biopolymer transport protein TolQ